MLIKSLPLDATFGVIFASIVYLKTYENKSKLCM